MIPIMYPYWISLESRKIVLSDSVPGEPKNFKRLAGHEIKSMPSIFKTKMLIYHSKANLDEAILLGKIAPLYDQTMRKCL